MPELPEVELARRNLERWLVGRRIDEAHVAATRVTRGSDPRAIERLLVGRKVTAVARRGKWLRIGLMPRAALFSHLGMTGKWVRRTLEEPAAPSERARLTVGGDSVRYHDPRLFGRLVPSPAAAPIPEWDDLGPDALEGGIDALAATLPSRGAAIKGVLLDQALLAGIGNIHATEALWRARIDPSRAANSLSRAEVRRLADGLRGTLADTIAAHDAEEEIVYVEEDRARNPFAVYGRGGAPCPRCRTRLARSTLGGRGTVYCPRCQR